VVTFGGRYSNHILAVSQLGASLGFSTTGITRGTDLVGISPVLEKCRENGMKIVPVKTSDYYPVQKLTTPDLCTLIGCSSPIYVIPEGGTSHVSLDGVAEIVNEIIDPSQYSYIACAVGTGGTAAGLALGLERLDKPLDTKVLALPVLRGYTTLPNQGQSALAEILGEEAARKLVDTRIEFDGSSPSGRFGRPDHVVMHELRKLENAISIPLDYVYTGKALLHIQNLAIAGKFQTGESVLFLHTGGYQTASLSE
jgi:1-aminocyclopropane-1-carboxylate deaminase